MKCYTCDTEENFQSLKDYHPERELMVCKTDGNICFRVEPVSEDKVKEYYRKEYRPAPTYMNLLTTTNKLNYIRLFLQDYLKDKKGLLCGDVGCATGYVPNWLRSIGHRATGCEYTLTYRRFAEHFYGFPVTEELPTKHKYDFISIYHVLEHIVEPDKKLAHYAGLLKDDGRMMVATPIWLNELEEASGTALLQPGGSWQAAFQHWFHKDHINVFTETSIKRLFAKCGLVVEKEDFIQYGQTYLLRKAAADEVVRVPEPEKPEEVIGKIDKIREALRLAYDKKLREAVAVFPKFPEAWLKMIFENAMKQPDKQASIFGEAKPHLENNARMRMAVGMWFYQREEYEKAIECFNWLTRHKPNSDVYMHLGYCYEHLGNHVEAMRNFNEAQVSNPNRWQDSMNWMCRAAASMPTWDERALGDLKEKLFEANKDKIKVEPVDPLMPNGNGDAPEKLESTEIRQNA